jgi:hypothetical protein
VTGATAIAATLIAAMGIVSGNAAIRRAHAEERVWLHAIDAARHTDAEAAAGRAVGWVMIAGLAWGVTGAAPLVLWWL